MTRYVAKVWTPGSFSRPARVEMTDTVTGDTVAVDEFGGRSDFRRLDLAKRLMVAKARDRALRHMAGVPAINRTYDGCLDLDCHRAREDGR